MELIASSTNDMRAIGAKIATHVGAGDLIMLSDPSVKAKPPSCRDSPRASVSAATSPHPPLSSPTSTTANQTWFTSHAYRLESLDDVDAHFDIRRDRQALRPNTPRAPNRDKRNQNGTFVTCLSQT